jgi:hypothetical protein
METGEVWLGKDDPTRLTAGRAQDTERIPNIEPVCLIGFSDFTMSM